MSVFDWSTTASSNGNADATINFQENQAPSTVNDSARALMSRVAYWVKMLSGNNTQGGTSNAYTITTGESLSAYGANMRFTWTPNADSTGATTLNVDAIGAKKVYLPTGVQAGSGDIESNSVYDVVYQTALDSAAGGFKIVGSDTGAEALAIANAALPSSSYTAADVLTKIKTVDGAGSGLDADTLDGVQASAFAQLSGADFTGAVDSTAGMTANTFIADAGEGGKLGVWGSTANYVIGMENSYTYGALSGYAMSFTMANVDTQGWIWRRSDHSLSQGAMSLSAAGLLTCSSIAAKPASGTITTGALTAAANANKVTQLTGNPTITGSVFTAGDVLVLYAGSAARTITQGAGMTMRLDGTATTGSRTLAARGMAVVYMVSATECVVSGGAVS